MISMDPMKTSQVQDPPLGDLPLFNWLASQAELKSSAERARELGLRVIVSTGKPPAQKKSGLAKFGGFAARAEPEMTTIPEDTSFRKLFTERRSTECSWICDEPDLTAIACCAPVLAGKSWCSHHAARVLIKPAR